MKRIERSRNVEFTRIGNLAAIDRPVKLYALAKSCSFSLRCFERTRSLVNGQKLNAGIVQGEILQRCITEVTDYAQMNRAKSSIEMVITVRWRRHWGLRKHSQRTKQDDD